MRVIVTRPEADAQRWVLALSERGLDALALPLISIHPVVDMTRMHAAWHKLGDYAALMFVSGSAVEHFFAARLPSEPGLNSVAAPTTRAWATGPGTAAALLRQGVDLARIDVPACDGGQFDSEALWALVGAAVRPGDRVLIVRGADVAAGLAEPEAGATPGRGRDWLAQRLLKAGAQVRFLSAYWRGAPVFDASQVECARQAATDGSIWLFTSAQAIANLTACLPRQDWAGARALVTHARIAAAARAAGFGVVGESRPSVADVVASIESIG